MKAKLTDRLLRSIDPPATGRTVITDTERAGLRFRATPSGARSFLFEKQVKGGRRIAITIGTYPEWSLAEARAEALRIELEAQAGIDRLKVANEQKAAFEAAAARVKTVGEVLDTYLAQHIRINLKEGLSRAERERQLMAYLEPFRATPIGELSRADIQQIVDAKAAEGKLTMANRLRSAVCAFTAWAFKRDYIDLDPGVKVQRAAKEKSRTRTPSVEEVREIWAETFELGEFWGPLIRLLILTGQRRNEVAKAEWSWIDLDRCQLEIPDPKNGKPHVVHLSDAARVELSHAQAAQVERGVKSKYVFSTNGVSPTCGLSKAVERLRNGINLKRTARAEEPMRHWTLHDLRRSQATALAKAGYPESVVDRIQNHVASGSRPSAVAQVYQLYEMGPERAGALDHWAKVVTG